MSVTHAGLRLWAKGLYPLEAAVELLARTADGRFASPGYPWIQPCDQPGWWWLDHEQITDDNLAATDPDSLAFVGNLVMQALPELEAFVTGRK